MSNTYLYAAPINLRKEGGRGNKGNYLWLLTHYKMVIQYTYIMYSIELRLLSTHYVEDFMTFYVRRNLYHARIIHVNCLGFLF